MKSIQFQTKVPRIIPARFDPEVFAVESWTADVDLNRIS